MNNVDFYLMDLKSKFGKINPKEYYLSYSGGKDSHFLFWFIKEYLKNDDIKIVGINTYMEHPEIRKRIYENCDIVLLPTKKPFEIKEKYGIPCFSKWQDDMIHRYQNGSRQPYLIERITGIHKYTGEKIVGRFKLNNTAKELLLANKLHKISPKCCTKLKKEPARRFEKESGLKPILGVRGNESGLRKKQYQSCFTKDKKFTPLWDLTDEMLDAIYKQYNIEIPKVYEKVCRTGCMGCPYGSYKHDTEKELALLSKSQREFVTEYFKESYEVLGIKIEGDK